MYCPRCNVTLLLTERHGVQIDYCPQCRGIWLDRDELDKIIERSHGSNRFHDEEDYHHQHHSDSHDRHRKKSWLSQLFD